MRGEIGFAGTGGDQLTLPNAPLQGVSVGAGNESRGLVKGEEVVGRGSHAPTSRVLSPTFSDVALNLRATAASRLMP